MRDRNSRLGRRSWRAPMRPDVAAEVKRVRARRKGPAWVRPLGVMLLGVAVLAAMNPDYPLPSPVPANSSAMGHRELVPELVEPVGLVEGPVERFAWRWPGGSPTSTLVIYDEQMLEIERREVLGRGLRVDAALRARLGAFGAFHWTVEGEQHGRTVVSAPAAVGFSR